MAFDALFQPLKIGPVEIKNRIALAPLNTMFSLRTQGQMNEELLAFYAARARGGVGLVISEACLATRLASRFPAFCNLHLFELSHVHGLAELVETVHSFGARIFLQLSPGFGRQGASLIGEPSPAPSPIPWVAPRDTWARSFDILRRHPDMPGTEVLGGGMPREMTTEEIQKEIGEFASSARLAVMTGADGLELHLTHGYLAWQFLSPRSNKRTDQYGGSLENRMRFMVEIITKTRESVAKHAPRMPIGVRVSADEHTPGGVTYEEMKKVVKTLVGLGIDYIHMSDGTYEAFKYLFPDHDGTMLEEAQGFKKLLGIPIITPSVYDPRLAEKAVSEGKTDMVSLGRQLIADPEWPNKVQEGRVKDLVRCPRDNFCIVRFLCGLPVRCTRNPNVGREKYDPANWRPRGITGNEVLPGIVRKGGPIYPPTAPG